MSLFGHPRIRRPSGLRESSLGRFTRWNPGAKMGGTQLSNGCVRMRMAEDSRCIYQWQAFGLARKRTQLATALHQISQFF